MPLFTCLLPALLGTSLSALPAPPQAYLIGPGRSLGHLRLGAATTTLRWLGPPAYGDAAMQQSWATWCNQHRQPAQLDVYAALPLPPTRTATTPVLQAIRTTSHWDYTPRTLNSTS